VNRNPLLVYELLADFAKSEPVLTFGGDDEFPHGGAFSGFKVAR